MSNLQPIVSPINLSTTFSQKTPEQSGYSRVDNPTRLTLEQKLAPLEKAEFCLVFSSGSAAIATLLSTLKVSDHIILHHEIYEGTLRLLEKVFKKFNLKFDLVDLAKINNVAKILKTQTKLILFENITNPTLNQIKVKPLTQFAKKHQIKVVVDNTFSTPLFSNPLLDGADIILHSLTKFISGHHDVTAGAIFLNDKKVFNRLKFFQHTIGAVPSPFDCFLILQHLKTFPLRMKLHHQNAKQIANFLKKHPKILKVNFPNQSGLVSFWIKGNNLSTLKFLKKLKLIKIAHSLGGTDSTILHPQSMMTLSFNKNQLEKLGITNNLVRLSVGLENCQDIINDLSQALK